jgi:hypothetical protein
MFLRSTQADVPALAASLLAMLEADGPSLCFLRAFAESPRPVRRLVVQWLALGWSGAGGTATDLARRR